MVTHPKQLCSIPTATGAIARLACSRLRESGKDDESIIAKAGATSLQVNDDTVRLEVSKEIKILELAAEELHDEFFGFHLARDFDLREIGLVYYVIASSERLIDALLNGKRYCAIVNQGIRVDVKRDKQSISIIPDYVGVNREADRHQIEFWLVAATRICRQVTDTRLAPRRVRIKHRRERIPLEFKTFFGCEVDFGADGDEIIFPASVASLPIVSRDQFLHDLLRQHAEEALSDRTRSPTSLRSTIEGAVTQLLPHGKANLTNVSRDLAIGSRTLIRRLGDEGLTFRKVLDESRVALAKHYLAERDLQITEVAWLLGFSEGSALSHAFKRWTGLTPRQFRMSLT
jgi:AraC-like DNA-binding protein